MRNVAPIWHRSKMVLWNRRRRHIALGIDDEQAQPLRGVGNLLDDPDTDVVALADQLDVDVSHAVSGDEVDEDAVRARLDLTGRRTIASTPFLMVSREGEGRLPGRDVDVQDEATGRSIALFRCTQMILYPRGA